MTETTGFWRGVAQGLVIWALRRLIFLATAVAVGAVFGIVTHEGWQVGAAWGALAGLALLVVWYFLANL